MSKQNKVDIEALKISQKQKAKILKEDKIVLKDEQNRDTRV